MVEALLLIADMMRFKSVLTRSGLIFSMQNGVYGVRATFLIRCNAQAFLPVFSACA